LEVIIVDDAAAAAATSGQILSDLITSKPSAVLGLATGNTPLRLYQALIKMHQQEQLSFKDVHTFNLDEYIGIEAGNRLSYRHYMNSHLFEQIDISINNTHLPDGMAADPQQEGADYEQVISNAGGIDLQILGIGSNGHIGFNEPTSSMASRTRVKTLTQSTIADNSKLLKTGEFQPHLAITMGIATIMEARQLVMIATGEQKAQAIKATVEGPLSAMCPASALQMHPHAKVIVDEAAAEKLELKDYYRWVYQENQLLKSQ
jgi:glucosamine-6-phosphate deaminase